MEKKRIQGEMAWLQIPDMEHVGIPSRPSRWRKTAGLPVSAAKKPIENLRI